MVFLIKKRNNIAIRGILVDGVWIDSPFMVKNEFMSHFENRFNRPSSARLSLDMIFPKQLSLDTKDELEKNVTKDELKRAVWDYGLNKSPGPDGFTFGFYQRYWSFLENHVMEDVSHFFLYGKFPRGGNSSFIALIPKSQNANMVKYYCPISLIRSLYKIMAKILANRLVVVLGDIVSDVKLAFIAGRQILDGHFILNDFIQWFKAKKKQTMIFKVDFEKAFDSVRWDYLDDVLKSFGFGNGWVDVNEKKMSWVSWNKVLASKEKGGLGGLLGKPVESPFPSIWLDIIRDLDNLKDQDIDLLGLFEKKIGGQKIRSTTVIILVTGADNGSVCGPAHDESMIVEILELKDDITDSVSATWFLQDLAIGQSAEGSIVSFGIQVEIMKSDLSELKSSAPLYGGSNELLFDALSDALAFDLPVTSNLAKGTTTVAFIFKDGVMVAVHSRASMGRYMSYGQCINFTKSMFSPKTPSHLQNEFFNRLGVLLMEASLVLSTNNQLTAELLAIRSACRLALTYGWQNAIVESDCNVDI
ncbi:RNA-directed DNA polymerase, eukaryota, reverse transcriptase zinc-binding domain protein [Tanacetum coccineum]|uniref:RNA-directed DNA polymerase, eukaryota, reverse transcriptase zinc-binding domain protein n=1 Tax=Tanacetum coccineum TaxID=301880 RepID=A0ABQ5IXC0_9ASTR